MSPRRGFIRTWLCLVAFFAAGAGGLASCKQRPKMAATVTDAAPASLSLQQECDQFLKATSGQTTPSEESLYRGLFAAFEGVEVPLDKDQEAYFRRLWDEWSHLVPRLARNAGQKYATPPTPEGLRRLFRAYVMLLGEQKTTGAAENSSFLHQQVQNSTLGEAVAALQKTDYQIYLQRFATYFSKATTRRGAELDELILAYMISRYPDSFHRDAMQALFDRSVSSSYFPQDKPYIDQYLATKTTPALSCNNAAAQLISQRIPWNGLGMQHYAGFGYIPWFHEPIARFYQEHPVVSSFIPVFGSVMAAGNSLLDAVEGRDIAGNERSRITASIEFTFHYTVAVFEVFSVKAAVNDTATFAKRTLDRIRGLPRTPSGLQQMTASLADEAMKMESAATPLRGKVLTPCLAMTRPLFMYANMMFAAGSPCLTGLHHTSKLHTNISNSERIAVIRDMQLDDIMSAPGHSMLRKPDNVLKMAEVLRNGGSLATDTPITLNVFTHTLDDGAVAVRSVEVIDGNHRLAAGILSGKWKTVADIPKGMVTVQVNGWAPHGSASLPRWIPLDVAKQSQIPSWFKVPSEWGPAGPSAQIPGWVASVDEVIAPHFRGVPMRTVLKKTLERVDGH